MGEAGGGLFCLFRRPCGGGFLGSGTLRGGLGSARQHAKLFEQLFLAAQGYLRDLEILRSPVVEGSQSGIPFTGGLLRRTFGGLLLLVGGIISGNLEALALKLRRVVAVIGQRGQSPGVIEQSVVACQSSIDG